MRFWLLPLLALSLAAQTPTFEVASIRLTNQRTISAPICGSLRLVSESVLASGVYRLSNLIEDGYQKVVDDFDLPQWARTQAFAVSVNVPPNTSVDTCRQMLRNLLAERFQLVTAVETREVARYHLKVAKSGLKLKPAAGPPADPKGSAPMVVATRSVSFVFRGALMSSIFNSIKAAASMDARARALAGGGSVKLATMVDETGVTGYYDGELQFTMLGSADESPLPESLNDALVRQLGLTLEIQRSPGQVLVIRSSDRSPTEN